MVRLYPTLCSSRETRIRGLASSLGCAGRRPRIAIRSATRRRTRAGCGCSQSSTRTLESLRETLTCVCTNFGTKTGGPLKCALIGCSCLSQHPELTTTASPFSRRISEREGVWVCPETKTSISRSGRSAFVGGLRSVVSRSQISCSGTCGERTPCRCPGSHEDTDDTARAAVRLTARKNRPNAITSRLASVTISANSTCSPGNVR